jgi:hypothetical protein
VDGVTDTVWDALGSILDGTH